MGQLRKIIPDLLIFFGIFLTGIGFTQFSDQSAHAESGAREVTVSQSSELINQVVTISWSGFTPTLQNGAFNTVVMQCPLDPDTVSDCFTAEPYPSTENGNRKYGFTKADGTGSVQFEVRPAANLPELNCSKSNPCSILVFENDAQLVPPGELPATATFARLNFAKSVADCPPVVDFDVRADGSSSASQVMYRWAAEKCAGKDSLVIDYTNTNDNTGRENFLSGLVDVAATGAIATKEELKHHSDPRDFIYAPISLSAVVVATHMTNPVNGEPITNLTLSPRLVARLITDSEVTSLFSDPEFRRLNVGVYLPTFGNEYPLLRAEMNADTGIITSWMSSDERAQLFLADEDYYGKHINPAYLGLEYPRDIFENVAQSANFLPRQGEENVALKLFYGIAPAGSVPLDTSESGLLGVLDLPTSRRFGLQTAKLVNFSGVAVEPTDEAILAGFNAMIEDKNGVRTNDFFTTDEAAYPLVKVDYLMIPTSGISNETNLKLQSLLAFAAGDGQDSLPMGYVAMPKVLRNQTLAAIDVLKTKIIPESTTTSTTTTTVYENYQDGYNNDYVVETTLPPQTTIPTTSQTSVRSEPLSTLPNGQSMFALPLVFAGTSVSCLGAIGKKRKK